MHMKQEFGIGPKEVTPRTLLIILRCEKNILALKKIRRAVCFSRRAVDFQLYRNTSKTQRNMYRWVWRIVSPRRAGEAGPRARGGSDAEEEGAVREGLREARETRAAGNREDARQGEGVPRGRPGDRPRAVDGRRRGGEAPARDVAAGASRRARAGGGGARGGVPAPGVVAAVPQRVLQAPGLRVLEEAEGLLRRAHGPARACSSARAPHACPPAHN